MGTRRSIPIESYALIADSHSAALVSKDGSIDWLCLPRFDSPAAFAAVLDPESGGRWVLGPAERTECVSRCYRDESLILETTFETDDGVAVVVDGLAVEPSDPTEAVHESVIRIVRGVRGSVEMAMRFEPRFWYGDVTPWFIDGEDGRMLAVGGPDALELCASVPLRREHHAVTARFTVREGESLYFVASHFPAHGRAPSMNPSMAESLIGRAESFWRDWVTRCSQRGPYRDHVVRSLLTLKALVYAPSGGIVAAPTTSLPERIGGERNWDYRYCWLRDATFTLDVLLDYGYTSEAEAWVAWLLRAVAGDPEDMQIMYGLLGERQLWERELDWLDGYEGSKPVRIGNAAHSQHQLDVYGEVMDAFHSARRAGIELPPEAWELQCSIAEFVCRRWREPDEGIWEVRCDPKHFVHSKVMGWVALDRALKAADRFGADDVASWRESRDAIRAEVMEHGVHPERGFRRSYDSDETDASLLMLPLVGFVDAHDSVMVSTVATIESDLLEDGLVKRYRTEHAEDGLPPGEGTFLMTSFWLVDVWAKQGRVDDARELFERLLGLSNDVGLLSEEYDPGAKRLLGNFPQAFSHVALLAAARALETAGEAAPVTRGG